MLATVLAVATPIKIWNSARIEHRLQEQEKLLLAAKIEALKSQINPHFLFNTLTSISSLIRSQPDTARMLIIKLSALLRRLLRSHEHFVTLREELESIDEYLDIEVVRFGPKLRVRKEIGPDTLDVVVPSMILQPLVENSIKHGLSRKVGAGSITIRSRARARPRGHRGRGRRHGVRARAARAADVERHRSGQRPRTAARHLRRGLSAEADQRARPRHARTDRDSRADAPSRSRHEAIESPPIECAALRVLVVDDEQLAREELCYLLDQLGGIEVVGQAGNGLEALAAVDRHEPDLVFLDVQMPGLTGFEVARRLLERERRAAGPHLRHRLRPARDRGVRGERRGLPAEAGRCRRGSNRRCSGRGGGSSAERQARPAPSH